MRGARPIDDVPEIGTNQVRPAFGEVVALLATAGNLLAMRDIGMSNVGARLDRRRTVKEAVKRRAAGETLASIAKSYGVDISMISRL